MNQQQYEKWSAPFRASERAKHALACANKALTTLGYVALPLLVVLQVVIGPWEMAARTVLTAGIAFVALSICRYFINAPRPYESLDIVPLIHKDTAGKSFPSRHTFSMFMIAFCWMAWCAPVGVVLMVTGAALAATRVLAGVHWPRDVIAAFIFAAVAALIGFILI